MNDAQMETLFLDPNVLVAVGGRGTGKSLIQALRMLEVAQLMPKSCSAFVTKSGTLAKRNTLPSIMMHWDRMGYKKGVHYQCWRKPRKELNWPLPLFVPETWDLVISWYTGAIIVIVSQGDLGTSNSINFDHIFVDEAKFINFERLKDETIPANRGQIAFFGECHLHHGMTITGDMPVTKKGSWFLSYEQKYNSPLNLETIEVIRALVFEQWDLKQKLLQSQQPAWSSRLKQVEKDLNFFRKKAVFYKEYSSLYNLALLGEEWFRTQRRDLPEATFYTTIMCEKSEVNKDGFYACLKPYHKYSVSIFNYLDNEGPWQLINLSEVKGAWRKDTDLQLNEPLCIAVDYNSKIQPMVVGQRDEDQRRLNVVNAFFVKYERKLEALCEDFDAYYSDLPNKTVVFYYDHTGINNNYAVNGQDYSWVIETTLKNLGWIVISVYIGHAWNHLDKMLLINRAFDGRTRLQPFFNAANCKDLLISIKEAGVYNGKKDKRDEKDDETQESLLEHRTDFSDAFDTLVIGCEKFPQMGGSTSTGSSCYIPH